LTSRQEKLLYFHHVIFIHFSRGYKVAGQADTTISKLHYAITKPLLVPKFVMILNLSQGKI